MKVKDIVLTAFSQMENQFNILKLIRVTKEIAGRDDITNNAVVNVLKKAKKNGEIDYSMMSQDGIYYKLKDWEPPKVAEPKKAKEKKEDYQSQLGLFD